MTFPAEVLRVWKAVDIALRNAPTLIYVAVSGGEDSHVLLHALLNHSIVSSRQEGPEIRVLHVNHGLRIESDWEEVFIRQLADFYRVGLTVRNAPPKTPGENVEAWARKQRYDFFAEITADAKAPAVVCTGHHEEDQAETVLQRVINGRLATSGICIARQNESVLRPLLETSKEDIRRYRRFFGLSVVYDGSNSDLLRNRNLIRHELLPQLKRDYNPQLVPALNSTAQRLASDESFLDAEANRRLKDLRKEISTAQLRNEPDALQWRILKSLAARALGPDALRLGYRNMIMFRDKIMSSDSSNGFTLDLGFGILGRKSDTGAISFERQADPISESEALPSNAGTCELMIPGTCVFDNGLAWEITAELFDDEREISIDILRNADNYSGIVSAHADCYFDADQLEDKKFSIRTRALGDRMNVWRRGHRKVKKLLQEKDIALPLRDSIPLITAGDDILWIPGVARSHLAEVKDSTARIVKVSCMRKSG
jgi:tRNA(Ile)-lysidine synthase